MDTPPNGHYVEPDDFGEERARELYQYYRPPTDEGGDAVVLPYADTVMQAHCQLAALRLNVQRAIICLVNKDTQFFVAEATKSLVLEDSTQSEDVDDGLCYGSVSVPKRGGLVEFTLAQEPCYENDELVPAHFEVLDLTCDSRWSDRKRIATAPHFRYYCGVPLRTENDINIGCLFLMDTQIPETREPISIRHIKLLATCAKNVMFHLQTVREAKEKQRVMTMNMCMADFIDPRDRFRKQAHFKTSDGSIPRRGRSRPAASGDGNVAGDSVSGQARGKESRTSAADSSEAEYSDDCGQERGRPRYARSGRNSFSACSSLGPPEKDVTEADHQRAFDSAALLLRQSLDLSLGGGVVFMDASAPADESLEHMQHPTYTEKSYDHAVAGRSNSPSNEPPPHFGLSARRTIPALKSTKTTYDIAPRERALLAAASILEPGRPPIFFGRADSSYKVHISPPELLRMCKKYPRGKLYSVPGHLPTTHYDSEGRFIPGVIMSAKLWYQILLRRQFPDAKQVIFVPMFYAYLNRWTACFVYTSSPYRVFSYETDYLHTLSFCNAIRAEIVKLATAFADQQKSGFISSVSHELRSPLHGILAAIEFLQDTDCSPFQKSCLETADACAHTLLDTITMVLEYSKVSSLKRPSASRGSTATSQAERARDATDTSIPRLNAESLSDSSTDCDLAHVTEEVIDGLATGHLSKHRPSAGFDDVAPEPNKTLIDLSVPLKFRAMHCATRPEVELVLDIRAPADWNFTTQPGAFKRIVMNLFTNSLKYTKHGYITICLRVVNDGLGTPPTSPEREKTCLVKLTVEDTGQGISPEYLRTKIFTPFSQEDAKAAGNGLGLSIVKELVDMLQGNIDIKSILNMGTIVAVILPMKRAPAQEPNSYTLNCRRPKDPSVVTLQRKFRRPQAAVFEPALQHDSFGQVQGATAIHRVLMQYLKEWFHMPAVQSWNCAVPAQLLIVDEVHLPAMLAERSDLFDSSCRQSIIVLCANAMRQATLAKDIQSGHVELLCKPFGPYKLARAICRALDKAAKLDARIESVDPSNIIVSPTTTSLPTSPTSTPNRDCTATTSAPSSLAASPITRLSEAPSRPLFLCQSSAATQRQISSRVQPKERSGEDAEFPFPPTASKPRHVSPPPPRRPSSAQHKSDPAPKAKDQSTPSVPTSSAGVWITDSPPLSPRSRKPRLLLVDDNKVNLKLLHTFVKKKGYGNDIVDIAEDGLQAVNIYTARANHSVPPDIIFMDISMPVMDGYEATRTIRQCEAGRREDDRSLRDGSGREPLKRALIVALTGNAGANDQIEAFESGVDVYMTKPMSMKEVGKLLENWRE